jgi:hypothetical protein
VSGAEPLREVGSYAEGESGRAELREERVSERGERGKESLSEVEREKQREREKETERLTERESLPVGWREKERVTRGGGKRETWIPGIQTRTSDPAGHERRPGGGVFVSVQGRACCADGSAGGARRGAHVPVRPSLRAAALF